MHFRSHQAAVLCTGCGTTVREDREVCHRCGRSQ